MKELSDKELREQLEAKRDRKLREARVLDNAVVGLGGVSVMGAESIPETRGLLIASEPPVNIEGWPNTLTWWQKIEKSLNIIGSGTVEEMTDVVAPNYPDVERKKIKDGITQKASLLAKKGTLDVAKKNGLNCYKIA